MDRVFSSPFWIAWWAGLATFIGGIFLVGAIPGDQRVLSSVLAALWLLIVAAGIFFSERLIWASPLTYWALLFAVSCTLGRFVPSDWSAATVVVLLLAGLPLAAVIWWLTRAWRWRKEAQFQAEKTVGQTKESPAHPHSATGRAPAGARGPLSGSDLLTAMALITACIAIAAVASVFAWTIGDQAKQEARVASTNPSSYGPACDAYFSTVTSYEDALLENFSYACQVELAEARTRTAILQQSAEATSGRAKVAWLVAGAAALAAVGVWLAYYLEAARRGTSRIL